ncbi:IclR family transcriptional regulator [Novosphingobium sp. BL-52-GroH]|uniref:IclR family transcriptional regulator n=1 Tax=Novosphingobium sp. BL-52-GroH TaxID=3349877 RepID=UPI00384B47B6
MELVKQSAAKRADSPAVRSRSAAAGTGTVHRIIRLIAAIAAARDNVGVGELAQKLSLPIPTIHRLLHLLRSEGVVEWDARAHRYMVGPELHRISAQVTSLTMMNDVAKREIAKLSDQTGETVLFGIYQPGTTAMSFEVRAEGGHPLQYRIQMHVPLSLVWGASGKAILAYLPEPIIERALAQEVDQAQSGMAPPTLEQLLEELERCRQAGFSVSEGEKLAGARGVAAPVFGLNGVIGSICMTSPKERIPINRVAEFGKLVTDAARALSRSLGAPDV